MARPTPDSFQTFYQQRYIDAATGESVTDLIKNHSNSLINFINSIPEEKADSSYAAGKWTVKQMLQHIIDTERIFAYRALCFSRNEPLPLPGFDENSYAVNAPATHRTLASLKEEFVIVRQSTDLLITSFTEEQLNKKGVASNYVVSVNALCFIIFGHIIHHKKVLQERYFSC